MTPRLSWTTPLSDSVVDAEPFIGSSDLQLRALLRLFLLRCEVNVDIGGPGAGVARVKCADL